MEKIIIIIVNWNTGEYLARCIESLVRLPERDMIDEVIVVDNASADKSIIKAKDVVGRNINQPRVRFIQNDKNIGFAAANNIGLDRVAQKEGNPHVLLLNPDTEVIPGMLTELSKVLEVNDQVGVVGPKLMGGDSQLQPSVRRFPTARDMVLYMMKLGRLVREADIDYDKEQPVDQVMGAAFLIKNSLLADIGQLDDNFFVWFEEVDYCKRAKDAGWLVWYTPAAQCIHYGGVSFKQLIGFRKTFPWLKSMMRYSDKHMGRGVTILLYSLSVINILMSIPASVAHAMNRR